MIRQDMYEFGAASCGIREVHAYGVAQAAIVGAENVYDFSIGNPSVPAPQEVTDTFLSLLNACPAQELHSYTSADGDVSVRAAIAQDLNARFGVRLRAQDLFLTCGSSSALTAVIGALAVEGAEFVVQAPFFPEYRPFIEASGSKFVLAEADREKFEINLPAMERAITARTQAVIINSPNNPSGVIYSRENLQKLAELLERKSCEAGHPIYIIADEPYRELHFADEVPPFIPTIYKDTIVCYSYSKSLSLPGERLGYFCIGETVSDSRELYLAASGAARIQGHICAPSILQKTIAACVSLRPDVSFYAENSKLLYNALTSYGYHCVKPQGAFYLFVQSPDGDAQAFSEHAKKENVLLVPGDDFGVQDYLRVSTCVSREMMERSLPMFEKLIKTYRK